MPCFLRPLSLGIKATIVPAALGPLHSPPCPSLSELLAGPLLSPRHWQLHSSPVAWRPAASLLPVCAHVARSVPQHPVQCSQLPSEVLVHVSAPSPGQEPEACGVD